MQSIHSHTYIISQTHALKSEGMVETTPFKQSCWKIIKNSNTRFLMSAKVTNFNLQVHNIFKDYDNPNKVRLTDFYVKGLLSYHHRKHWIYFQQPNLTSFTIRKFKESTEDMLSFHQLTLCYKIKGHVNTLSILSSRQITQIKTHIMNFILSQ